MVQTPRRDFLKGLAALPALAATSAAEGTIEYELNEFPVAGFPFHDGPAVLHDLSAGDALVLVREPDNPHDPNAIRIEADGRHIGYVPRTQNAPLVRLLEQGVTLQARVVGVDPGSWNPVTVAVSFRA